MCRNAMTLQSPIVSAKVHILLPTLILKDINLHFGSVTVAHAAVIRLAVLAASGGYVTLRTAAGLYLSTAHFHGRSQIHDIAVHQVHANGRWHEVTIRILEVREAVHQTIRRYMACVG